MGRHGASLGGATREEDLAGKGRLTIWGCCCCCCGARFWVAEASPKALRGFIEKTMLAGWKFVGFGECKVNGIFIEK
jgi:hypothetical protein